MAGVGAIAHTWRPRRDQKTRVHTVNAPAPAPTIKHTYEAIASAMPNTAPWVGEDRALSSVQEMSDFSYLPTSSKNCTYALDALNARAPSIKPHTRTPTRNAHRATRGPHKARN